MANHIKARHSTSRQSTAKHSTAHKNKAQMPTWSWRWAKSPGQL
jgi:hypothetical protein